MQVGKLDALSARVESVEFDGAGKLSVRYSPFGRNGTFPGPSRSEIYINWRRQSKPSSSGAFVFSEATRTVYLAPAQQRELSTISDAETLCRFERLDADTIAGRQRVLRYLTPNPTAASHPPSAVGALFLVGGVLLPRPTPPRIGT